MPSVLYPSMPYERYLELIRDENATLTAEEISAGWHFCVSEWDGLLIHKDDPEAKVCSCFEKKETP